MRLSGTKRKIAPTSSNTEIDFPLARLAFDDPCHITIQDREVEGEQRYQLIGALFTRLILVAHAISVDDASAPDDLVVRIISARKATPSETKAL